MERTVIEMFSCIVFNLYMLYYKELKYRPRYSFRRAKLCICSTVKYIQVELIRYYSNYSNRTQQLLFITCQNSRPSLYIVEAIIVNFVHSWLVNQ